MCKLEDTNIIDPEFDEFEIKIEFEIEDENENFENFEELNFET